jgi:hypothetical protein
MEENEIVLFNLYSAQDLPRGNLPYTPAFDRIVAEYNQRTNSSASPAEVWHLLENMCKQGEPKIQAYLNRQAG